MHEDEEGDHRDGESLDPADWEAMRALAHRAVDDAVDYLEGVRERPVWRPVPDEVAGAFHRPAPMDPEGPESAYEDFRKLVMPYPMGNIHPRFWSWFMGSGTFTGALGDFLAAVMNPNLGGGSHVAPLVEEQVIEWIRELTGFPPECGGLLVSGASMANLVGLAVARNERAGFDVRSEGLASPGARRLAIYASTEVHSCHQKAVELMGLGNRSLRRVPVNERFEIDVDALGRMIAEDRVAGLTPIAVIATAGTVNTGAIDDLRALADLCERERIWFHVDGAIGALLQLSERHRHRVAGMERADSLALDLHKWMHVPFEAGCVLVRDREAHRRAFALTPEYLEHAERGLAGGRTWFSDYGPQLTRGFRALKVWLILKEHGARRIGRLIARNIAQARRLEDLIKMAPELETMATGPLSIVCFRFNPGGLADDALDTLNRELLTRLHEGGIVAPSYTRLHGRFCLRAAIANHRTRNEDLPLLVDETVRLGRELAARTFPPGAPIT